MVSVVTHVAACCEARKKFAGGNRFVAASMSSMVSRVDERFDEIEHGVERRGSDPKCRKRRHELRRLCEGEIDRLPNRSRGALRELGFAIGE